MFGATFIWIIYHPDLLLPETYNDPMALAYFECLEQRLSGLSTENTSKASTRHIITAKPSNGHIGTSDPRQAGQWGEVVVSVWPLGDQISYVWPRDRETFFPYSSHDDDNNNNVDIGPQKVCREDNLVVNEALLKFRHQPREVLFASWFDSPFLPSNDHVPVMSSFLSIPMEYDMILRKELERFQYGL
jgi:hypothetical protein